MQSNDNSGSNCVRIVTPDEHVNTGFHEILIYDMGQEEWPQVPLSEIGCLRLDWPNDLFAFVGRYQLELEQMRKECRDRFGASASGTCPTCEKYIQINLGKHMPFFHRYRVFDRLGSHPAFRGPYMSKLFTFLKESDAESIRRSHRRRAKEIAVSMSKKTSESKDAPTDMTLSRRLVQRTVVSKITGRDAGPSLIPTAGGRPRSSASSIYRRSVEEDTVQALMDLSLPRLMTECFRRPSHGR